MKNYNSQQIFIVINAFLLLFIFIAGGFNKIANFKDTASYLETKINETQLNPIFIASIFVKTAWMSILSPHFKIIIQYVTDFGVVLL